MPGDVLLMEGLGLGAMTVSTAIIGLVNPRADFYAGIILVTAPEISHLSCIEVNHLTLLPEDEDGLETRICAE